VSLRAGAGGGLTATLDVVSAGGVDGAAFFALATVSLAEPGTAAALSFVETAGGFDENKRGVTTMTSAISASARSVRLSMQVVELP